MKNIMIYFFSNSSLKIILKIFNLNQISHLYSFIFVIEEEQQLQLSDFTDLQIIGKGAQSVVYSGYCQKLQQRFALKKIDKENIKQMNTEIYILQHTDNPYVLNLHCIIEDQTSEYLVLDLMKSTLLDILPLKIDQVKYLAGEICLGLQYLHSKHIIMRDLTASNILVDEKGYIKISDFGLSVIQDKKQCNCICKSIRNKQAEHSTLCGTMYNLAPEVILQKGAKYYTDYWQLGNLIYQMITGHLPFSNSFDIQQIYQNILKEQIPKNDLLSDDAYDLISQLMKKDGKERITIQQAMQHPFFKNIDWDKLQNKEYIYFCNNCSCQQTVRQSISSTQQESNLIDTNKQINQQVEVQRERKCSLIDKPLQIEEDNDSDDCLCQFDDL